MLRECLGQVRYVAAADRPGKRRLWVSRELKPTDSKAQRLSFGLGQAWEVLLSKCGFWQDIGTSEAGGLGLDPTQQKPGKPDFKLLLLNGFKAHRPPRQARTDKELVVGPIDFAILVDSPPDHLGIVQLLHPAAIAPSRMLIKLSGTTHSKGLMGALLVKLLAPQF